MGISFQQDFFNDHVKDKFQIAMITMLVLGVILDLICCKYRKFALGCFYYACVLLVLTNFIPIDYGYYGPFVTMAHVYIFVAFLGCH